MKHLLMFTATVILCGSPAGVLGASPADRGAPLPVLVGLMADELDYSMQHLVSDDGTRPYYLAYTIPDVVSDSIVGQLGAIFSADTDRQRVLDVDLRIGDYSIDNTHQIRGRGGGFARGSGGRAISIEDSPEAIRHALWWATDEQFKAFMPDFQSDAADQWSPEPDCPILITWYEAAAYCNWLSQQEGVPQDQWCYEANDAGEYAEGMKPAPDFLQRSGYRLPTEAEWECACRAGTWTGRSYGWPNELLAEYAWYADNAQRRSWPVGMLWVSKSSTRTTSMKRGTPDTSSAATC